MPTKSAKPFARPSTQDGGTDRLYPNLPFPGHLWRLSQHTGVASDRLIFNLLWAANDFSNLQDPAQEINNYAVTNNLVPPDVRVDTGQPDVWRDYQQVLSELGLIYTTKLVRTITPTPLGLALLDGSLTFTEVVTSQALRLQYPNGHHTQRQAVRLGTGNTTSAVNFAEAQALAGVRLRPGVLVWQVLCRLQGLGESATLNADDLERYLMPATTHNDTEQVVHRLVSARHGGTKLPRLGGAQRRKAQDWTKFLGRTALFNLTDAEQLVLSPFAHEAVETIDQICYELGAPDSFWMPDGFGREDRISWYTFFGSLDVLSVPAVPEEADSELPREAEPDEDDEQTFSPITLQEYQQPTPSSPDAERTEGATIRSVYSAEISHRAHRLHDNMVALIAEKCREKQAMVFFDPKTVDLLVGFNQREFLIEVKSVNFSNLIKKIRMGVGQVLHYDYLRAAQVATPRRRVLALATDFPHDHWVIPFLNQHVDMDFLCLDRGRLRVHSPSNESISLFG